MAKKRFLDKFGLEHYHNLIKPEFTDIGQENAELIAADLTKTITGGKYGKIGDMVVVYINYTTSEAITVSANGTSQIGASALDSGYRPAAAEYDIIRSTDTGLQLMVDTDGYVYLSNSTAADITLQSGTTIKGEVAYYV